MVFIMSQIIVNDLTFSYDTSYDNIFEHVSFNIDSDWKLGFIGRNGRGKTTFLNLLQNKYEYSGSISSSVTFDYFPFQIKNEETKTLQIIKDTIAPFTQWEKEMEECLLQMDKKNSKQTLEATKRYGEIQELYQIHDGYMIEEFIEKELNSLKVSLSVLDRPFSTLSFGERTKIMLGALFLKKNNFLLIDEPTNHLDMKGRKILSDYLNTKKGFILVSHDRTFLEGCIDHVLSINKTNIEVQKGNYSSWYHNKELLDQYELEREEQLKKDIASLEKAARRTLNWSEKVEGTKIGQHVYDRGAIGHKAAKMMKRSKSIESRQHQAINEKKELLKNFEQVDSLKMNLLSFPKERMIEAIDLSLYYDERKIISSVDFFLRKGERIALRGDNGTGKSTLLKLILGYNIKHTGEYYVAPSLKISYVSQDTSYLSGNLIDFAVKYGLDETIFKTVLRQLDFSREQFEKNIEEFSGGQKKKVLLAKSLSEPAQVFLWDEPLNFIDVLSRVQIEDLILKYEPTMIFVEHDKVFSDKIATKVLLLNQIC